MYICIHKMEDKLEIQTAPIKPPKEEDPALIMRQLWDAMDMDFDAAMNIFVEKLHGGRYHAEALELFKQFYENNWRTLNMGLLSSCAAIFANEPTCVAQYKDVCMRIKQLLRMSQEGVPVPVPRLGRQRVFRPQLRR